MTLKINLEHKSLTVTCLRIFLKTVFKSIHVGSRSSFLNTRYFIFGIETDIFLRGGARLRHCATSRKVWARFPIGSMRFSFYVILPSALWPLGSTQPLKGMSTRNMSWWVKTAGAKCRGLNSCRPKVLSRPVMRHLFPFCYYAKFWKKTVGRVVIRVSCWLGKKEEAQKYAPWG
jgi:hypothetical protein